jgi:hypothetical protein
MGEEDKAFARCRGRGLTANLEDVGSQKVPPGAKEEPCIPIFSVN